MNYLFMTIGQRDCMEVYQKDTYKHRRKVKELNEKYEKLLQLPFIASSREDYEGHSQQSDAEGIDFPMLCKNIYALQQEHKLTSLDYLVLIITNRRDNIELLQNIINTYTTDEFRDCLHQARQIKDKFIKDDSSKSISDLIIQKKEQICDALGFDIRDIIVLEIGEVSEAQLPQIVSATPAEVNEYLQAFDINNSDFLTRQFHNALMQHFDLRELDSTTNNIYLSLSAGGLPSLQKATDNIMKISVLNAPVIDLTISENSSYLKIIKDSRKYYADLQKAIQAIYQNDFYRAKMLFDDLKGYLSNEINTTVVEQIESLFEEIQREKEDATNWFYNLFSLFLGSVYKNDFITASVFLVSIEDQYLRWIIKQHLGMQYFKNNEKDLCIDGEELGINVNLITKLKCIDNNKFKPIIDDFMENYRPIFLKKNKDSKWNPDCYEYVYTRNFQFIRGSRNYFIHRGLSLVKNNNTKIRILNFLKITRQYNDFKSKENEKRFDWNNILQFEKSLLTEATVFNQLGKNIYNNELRSLTPERENGLEMIHLLMQMVL